MPFDEEELDQHGECRNEIAWLREKLSAIQQCLAPGDRNLDEMLRDMRFAHDFAKDALTHNQISQ